MEVAVDRIRIYHPVRTLTVEYVVGPYSLWPRQNSGRTEARTEGVVKAARSASG
jgi:hypothetical protein